MPSGPQSFLPVFMSHMTSARLSPVMVSYLVPFNVAIIEGVAIKRGCGSGTSKGSTVRNITQTNRSTSIRGGGDRGPQISELV